MVIRHRGARLVFLIATAVLIALWRLSWIGALWLALPLAVYEALIVHGSSRISSGFFLDAYCGADTAFKEIALTFDDGPNAEFTPPVLAALAEYGAPATFFVIGKNISGNEDLLRRMDAAGHAVGNHTFTHSLLIDFKSVAGFKEEIRRTDDAIERVLGKRPKFFRPPYGVTTPNVAKASAALGCGVIGWNVRSFDTTGDSEDAIVRRVLGGIKPGAVVLFHDASEKTVNVLRRTLAFSRERGYKVVSLERLMSLSGAAAPPVQS